jgi:hypothetical protein
MKAYGLRPPLIAWYVGRTRETDCSMAARFFSRTFLGWVSIVAQVAPSAAFAESGPPADKPSIQAPRSSILPIERWPMAIEVGGGISRGGRSTFEGTFSPDLGGPHLSIGYSRGDRGSVFYGEAAVNLLLTFGIGLDYHSDFAGASQWGAHGLVGLPIPIVGFGRDGASTPLAGRGFLHVPPLLLYCEPFYRPQLRSGADVHHEVGVVLKVRVGLTRRQWSLPGYGIFDGVTDL